jgi:hypothetical protein
VEAADGEGELTGTQLEAAHASGGEHAHDRGSKVGFSQSPSKPSILSYSCLDPITSSWTSPQPGQYIR